jgi:hypothetical protein
MAENKRIEVRLTPEQIQDVDEWRRHLPDLPPRAVAIVRLAALGLAAEKKKRPIK